MQSPAELQKMLETIDPADLSILVLVTGILTDGRSQYAYVSIPPARYLPFKEAEAKGNYDLAQFGKILAYGEGKNPPAEVKERMEREHGVNHTFEEEIKATFEELRESLKTAPPI